MFLPFEFCRDHLVLPLGPSAPNEDASHTTIRCLTARSDDWQALDNLSLFLNAPLELIETDEITLREQIGQTYQAQMAAANTLSHPQEPSLNDTPQPDVELELSRLNDRDLLASSDKEPVAKLVDALLFDALQKGASDVHVHPYPERLQVRYRIDGVLHNTYQPPTHLHEQMVGRIKVLAGMDVAEKRLPQDGRTSVQIGSRLIDMRVSTLPTTCGERVVIRLLEQTAKIKELGELGMPKFIENQFQSAILRSHGLILVTGPTGSGKTTTLYSALAQLDATQKNILTLEDPVEYRLEGISQTQVSAKKGMTFLDGLRHVLRQDPDVILIGEIRDEATARMVIQSSLTGHLVLTTLHTNNAASAVARLADLGIEPYLIASSLIGVLAQRLIRQACSICHGQETLGHGETCTTCRGTGFAGRTGLYEWLPASPKIKEQILKDLNATHLEAIAQQEGMKTLLFQGQEQVEQGNTTRAELLRVLGSTGESD